MYSETNWLEFLESVGLSECDELDFDEGQSLEEKLAQSKDKQKLTILLLRQFWTETQVIRLSQSSIDKRLQRLESEVEHGATDRGQLRQQNRQQRQRLNKTLTVALLILVASVAELIANFNKAYAPWFLQFLDVDSVRTTMTTVATAAFFAAIGIISGKPGEKVSQLLSIDIVAPLDALWQRVRRNRS